MGIGVEHEDTYTVLTCRGRLDSAALGELRATVTRCLTAGPRVFVFDMAGAQVTDTAALGTLVALHREARAVGAAFRLARVPYHVQALVAAAGLRSELPAYGTVEAAAAGQKDQGQ